jgi:putative transposase
MKTPAPSYSDHHRSETCLALALRTDELVAAAALDAFEADPWGTEYKAIAQSWRRARPEVFPFYAPPADVRRTLYTTNATAALNAQPRRPARARGHLPTDEAAVSYRF